MKNREIILAGLGAAIAITIGEMLCGCAGQYVPPMSVSAGWFGAQVTVAEPGFTVPAKVVPSQVAQPTLLVPATDPESVNPTTSVTNSTGQTASVPIQVSPTVVTPVLAVPEVKP